MVVFQRIAECVLGLDRRDTSVVVVHEPTARCLGPGLVLGERTDAVTFDDVRSAENFLARHASEPAFAVVPAGDTLAA